MGKGSAGNRYLETKRGTGAAVTTVVSLVILLLLNVGDYYHGAFQLLHYLSFSYLLNGAFFILLGLMGDMEPSRKYMMTYYGSGALLFLVNGFIAVSYGFHESITAAAIVGLSIFEGVLMAILAIFSKSL